MILINGNNVTITELTQPDVLMHIQERKLCKRQFSAMGQEDGSIHLTFPMTILDRAEFAAHIHRNNAEIRTLNPHLEPQGPGPKGTPPTGGTPGAARVTKFENTFAIAA